MDLELGFSATQKRLPRLRRRTRKFVTFSVVPPTMIGHVDTSDKSLNAASAHESRYFQFSDLTGAIMAVIA